MNKNELKSFMNNNLKYIIPIAGIVLIVVAVSLFFVLKLSDNQVAKYSITFQTNGGSETKSLTVKQNKTVTKPQDPVKENYKFAGWYYNNELYDFNNPITEDIKLEAKWEKLQEVSGVKLNHTTLILYLGDTSKLIATVMPENANNKNVSWKSTSPDIVSVDQYGTIKALKEGNATIIVTTEDGNYTAKVDVLSRIAVMQGAIVESNNYQSTEDYKILFKDVDGTVLADTQTVKYGNKVVEPNLPSKEGHTFIGWYNGKTKYSFDSKVKSNLTLVAKWVKNKYTITFVNYDGSTLQTKAVEYGAIPTYTKGTPTKASTEQYSYTFAGWSHKLNPVTGDATYTAVFTESLNNYEISFIDENDSTLISSQNVIHGSKATKPTNPSKEGHTFIGWYIGDAEYLFDSEVKSNLTITAKWQKNKYTITFVNYDGSVLETKAIEYGATPEYTKDIPTKLKDNTYTYTFAGWDKQFSTVAKDTTYTAKFDATYIDYVITFVNYDGTVLSEKTYHFGDTVTAPTAPTKASTEQYSYTFAGWSPEITVVEKDAKYTATFNQTLKSYDVMFKDTDGTTLTTQSVKYGGKATKPTNPSKEGHTFIGWYNGNVEYSFDNEVKADLTLTAKWQKNKYTITFVNYDGTVLETKTVEYGAIPTYTKNTPTKASTEQYTYVFAGWSPKITAVVKDATYTATFNETLKSYSVSFVDQDGTTLANTQTILYGNNAFKPIEPSKEGFTFLGWYNGPSKYSFDSEVKADLTLTAKWEKNKYTITFVNYDGSVLETKTLEYGSTPEYTKDIPTRLKDNTYTYTFAGWDKQISTVNKDTTYTAKFDTTYIDYVITFVNYDGTVLSEKTYHFGDTVNTPTAPTKASTEQYTYSFAGWSPEITVVEKDAKYTATFNQTLKSYDVMFKDTDGTTLTTQSVKYGSKATQPATPTKEGHAFIGWYNGNVEYSFDSEVKADLTLTAKWQKNKYTITFVNYDGTVLETKTVEYGAIPTYTKNTPTKASTEHHSYIFANWSPAITTVKGNTTYTATFTETPKNYNVMFKDTDGTTLTTQSVKYGNKATKPANPSKEGHTFIGWYNGNVEYSFDSEVKTDLTLTAKWQKNKYTITFVNYDGKVLETTTVEYGTTPKYTGKTPTKVSTEQYTYTFDGWSPKITVVEKDAKYTATFNETLKSYNVIFKDTDGTTLTTQSVKYGNKATKPATPSKEGHTFIGWYNGNTEYTFKEAVKSNLTLTAKWEKNKYTVTFKNYNGTVLETKTVEYGTTPKYTGETPSKPSDNTYSYMFTGWNPSVTAVKENTTYTAVFKDYVNVDNKIEDAILGVNANEFKVTKNGQKINVQFTSYKQNGWTVKPPYELLDIASSVTGLLSNLANDPSYKSVLLEYKGKTLDATNYTLSSAANWLAYVCGKSGGMLELLSATTDDLVGKSIDVKITLKDGYTTASGNNIIEYILTFSNK